MAAADLSQPVSQTLNAMIAWQMATKQATRHPRLWRRELTTHPAVAGHQQHALKGGQVVQRVALDQ